MEAVPTPPLYGPGYDRSGSCAYVATRDGVPVLLRGGGDGCRVAHVRRWARRKITTAAEVEDRGGRDDRHHSPVQGSPGRSPRTTLGTVRRDQAVGAAAGQDHGVHCGNQGGGIQGVGLMRPRTPPRTSTDPTVPGGGSTTVTPLNHPSSFFCTCPTRIPAHR